MIDNQLFRVRIGSYSNKCPSNKVKRKSNQFYNNPNMGDYLDQVTQVTQAGNVSRLLCFVLFLITYIYTLCLIMAFTVDISRSDLTYVLNRLPIAILHN